MEVKKVTRAEDYSAWYNNLVKMADLADHSDVKGCMVIKPYGYAIWEKMQQELDKRFKETGHQNAYFPLFIPKSFFSKEASHVDGFAKECAVVTHYRLKTGENNEIVVDDEARLEEELIVRPTSETIIWNTYRDWIKSYRDLPILVNQWANVVRWEMRTRLFLRTTEFLWQEGHTAHATSEEALAETRQMLEVYADFAENILAVPVIKGVKTPNERFAGALDTYCIEGLMQDGKALQMGTSHFLGQNFAKAFDVKYVTRENKQEYVWATSWGVSTRLMGALVMSHSDDDGLVLPPNLAPVQVVIIPILGKKAEEQEAVLQICSGIQDQLKKRGISVKLDNRDNLSPGFKYAEHELKGIPVRIAIGPRDVQNGTVEVARRDTKEKQVMSHIDLDHKIDHLLTQIQQNIYQKALDFRDEHITAANTWDEFIHILENKTGFVSAHWDGTTETELKIKELTKATIRCIPLNNALENGKCILTGNPSTQRVLFAKAY